MIASVARAPACRCTIARAFRGWPAPILASARIDRAMAMTTEKAMTSAAKDVKHAVEDVKHAIKDVAK